MTEENKNLNNKDISSPKKVGSSVNNEDINNINSKINNTKRNNLSSSMASMGANTVKNATSNLMDAMSSTDEEKSSTFKNLNNTIDNSVNTIKEGKKLVNKLKKDNKKKTTKTLKDIFIGKNKKFKILGTILSGGFILKVFLIIIVATVFSMVVQNLMIKFGLTGNDSYEVFNKKYNEYLSREDIDDIFDENVTDPCGPVSWLNKLKHFVGIYNLSNRQDLCLYISKSLEKKEALPGISTLGPGYFFSSFYYAYDTQNIDKDGHMFIEVKQPDDNTVQATDLDAVATLFETGIYKKEDIDYLLDNYILEYNFKQEDVHYYQWIVDEKTGLGACYSFNDYVYNEISETKFQAYLRFGSNVASSFQRDSNVIKAYGMTSSECLEKLENDLGPKPSLAIYSTKLDLTTHDEEIPTIVINNPYYPSI